ncbi:MAG: DUF47 family protein [Bacteroidaceae bacterium]
MGLFNVFIKKDNKILSLLNQMSAKLTEGAEELVAFMSSPPTGTLRTEYNIKIKEIESQGDDLYDAIFQELNSTFITPFDREDIQELAAKMDDVLDFIHGVAKRTVMYNVREIPAEFKMLSTIIHEQCVTLQTSMGFLGKVAKKPEFVIAACRKIHELETTADGLYADFVTMLFAECKDPIELIKLNGVVQYLEDTTDRSDDVADVIRTIIVKYN